MEPERPIEKLLRAFARKRRDEAGGSFELHPATRRLLQGEVARNRKSTADKAAATGQIPGRFWMRLLWSFGIVVIIGVGGALWLQPWRQDGANQQLAKVPAPSASPSGDLAMGQRLDQADSLKSNLDDKLVSFALQPSEAKTNVANSVEIATALRLEARRQNELERVPPAAPPQTTLAEADLVRKQMAEVPPVAQRALTVGGQPSREELAAAAPQSLTGGVAVRSRSKTEAAGAAGTSSPALGLAGPGRPSESEKSTVEMAQKFRKITSLADTQSQRESANKLGDKRTVAVLDSFDLEQNGAQIKIVDQDGSLYTGTIQSPGADRASDVVPSPTKVKETANSPVPASAFVQLGYFFMVTGTNRTLNLPVTFTGTVDVVSSVPNLSTAAANGGANLSARAFPAGVVTSNVSTNLPGPSPARVSGKAAIGKDQVIPVEAVPVSK